MPIYLMNYINGFTCINSISDINNINCFKKKLKEYKDIGCTFCDYISDIIQYLNNMNYYNIRYTQYRYYKKFTAIKLRCNNINRNDMKKHLTKSLTKNDFKELYINETYRLPLFFTKIMKVKYRNVLALVY